MKRTYAIGDLHGAYKALVQIIEKISPNESDRLIFMGDYVDGWSQSAKVISYLMELSKVHDCVFLKGNHDSWCEEWLKSGITNSTWLAHGGISTITSYEGITHEEKEQHLQFFSKLKGYFVDEQNRIFIHAGFSSLHGPHKERDTSNFQWDRTLWEMALAVDDRLEKNEVRYPKRLKVFKEIFIGHTPTINYGIYEPMRACNVCNVDTGAAFSGKLSALEINSYQVYQTDIVRELYPEELGRNRK